jgi:hypothetical protein
LRTGIAVGDVARCEDLVGELGAGFEGEGFGENEGVVAVEEKGGDLLGVSSVLWKVGERCTDLRSHLDDLIED